MKASELIRNLAVTIERCGDLEVLTSSDGELKTFREVQILKSKMPDVVLLVKESEDGMGC